MTIQSIVPAFTFMLILSLTSPIGSVAQHSPYAGQHAHDIKALSPSDIQSYLSGHGMGLAKAAELNHYPGPKHVLELAQVLHLTEKQRMQTQAIFDAMQQEAIQLGHQLIQAERHLDHLFSTRTVTEDALQEATQAIAHHQGNLRNVHLRAHLAQRRVLSEEQIQRYDHLRGYSDPARSGHPHRHQH